MTTTTEAAVTTDPTQATQVYRVYIKATPEAIWDAITKPEWSHKYGYTGFVSYDLRPGGAFEVRATEEFRAAAMAGGNDLPDVILDGEVLEADPPRKLVQSWRMLMDEGLASEGFTRLTYEITPADGGVTKLTVVHELENAPRLQQLLSGAQEEYGAGGGWAWVLSDLKSLLETGSVMTG